MQLFRVILCSCVLFLPACVHFERKVMFSEDEFLPYAEKGNASIAGDAFLKAPEGYIQRGAGNTILLLPVNAYTSEWFNHVRHYKGGNYLPQADPRYSKYERQTIADSDGRFEFLNLPAGQYYVATQFTEGQFVTWKWKGWVTTAVQVGAGEKKKVVVTGLLDKGVDIIHAKTHDSMKESR
jgi:hypothetical protein